MPAAPRILVGFPAPHKTDYAVAFAIDAARSARSKSLSDIGRQMRGVTVADDFDFRQKVADLGNLRR